MKLFYFDLETTDKYPRYSTGIHQIGGIIEIDGKIIEEINFNCNVFPTDTIEDEALGVAGITRETLGEYPEPELIARKLQTTLEKYVDRYNPKDKFHMVGYNAAKFDDPLLRYWWGKCGLKYYGSYFHNPVLDVMIMAGVQLAPMRHNMAKGFTLGKIYQEVTGETIDESIQLHDALDDIRLTRDMFKALVADRPGW